MQHNQNKQVQEKNETIAQKSTDNIQLKWKESEQWLKVGGWGSKYKGRSLEALLQITGCYFSHSLVSAHI